jgi:hypothetical protein
MTRWRSAATLLVVATLALVLAGGATADLPAPTPRAHPRFGSFVSLVPACGCTREAHLEQFSMTTGRPEALLGGMATGPGGFVSPVHVGPGSSITITTYRDPATARTRPPCITEITTFRYSPNGEVSWVPRGRTTVRALTTDMVPSPAGGLQAAVTERCHAYMDQHLRIDDNRTHHSWTIGADAPACHTLGTPQFDATGTRLVFPWGAARGRQRAGDSCPTPHASDLALVAAGHGSTTRQFIRVAPDPGCSYFAAAFDRTGIAAVEGCKQGSPQGFSDYSLGKGYIVQLSGPRHRVTKRIAIHRGVEQAVVAEDPATRSVLITQDQPANNGTPENDYVWSFDGTHLRLVGRYAAHDAAQILAAPW